MKAKSVTMQMKAFEQYIPVALFIMFHKVVLTFEFVDELLKCDHSNESGVMLFKVVLTYTSMDEILKYTIQMKATEQYLPVVLVC